LNIKSLDSGECVRKVQTAFVCLLILMALDNGYLIITHASNFLVRVFDKLLFFAMGVAIAVILAFPVALASYFLDRLYSRLRKPFTNPIFGLCANSALLLSTGFLIANSRSGHLFKASPISHNLVAMTPGLIFFFIGRIHVNRIGPSARYNFYSIVSFLTAFGTLVASAPQFYMGRFGLSGADRSSSLAMIGIVFGVIGSIHVYYILRSRRLSKLTERMVSVGLFISLIVIYWVNAYFYVDQYVTFHFALSLLSFLIAWDLAERFSTSYAIEPTAAVRYGSAVAMLISLLCVLYGVRPASVTGYVGIIHTVNYRFVLEPIYRLDEYVQDIGDLAYTFSRRVCKRTEVPFFIHPATSLPVTFKPFSLTEGVVRPHVNNLVIFFLDMKRPRDIGLYKESTLINPYLQRYFSDAFIFNNVFSAADKTSMALPPFYTGAYWRSVQYDNQSMHKPFWYSYQQGNALGHLFGKNGYQTTLLTNDYYYRWFFSKKELRPVFGGFTRIIKEDDGPGDYSEKLARAYKKTSGLFSTKKPFLTVVHMMSHNIGIDRTSEELIRLICNELETKRLWEKTVTIIVADHGLQLREHGRTTYGQTLFNEEVRVPYIIRIPGMKGRHVDDLVVSVDHLPSLLDLFGIAAKIKLEGTSYLPLFYGKSLGAKRAVYTHSMTALAVIKENMKLIRWFEKGPFALFDLKKDEGEINNLVEEPAYGETFKLLRKTLSDFDEAHPIY
jgi:hypothetical protein